MLKITLTNEQIEFILSLIIDNESFIAQQIKERIEHGKTKQTINKRI